ncbi:NADH-ubiquinone oxidoreductase subunit, mitochondrial, partial [Intoshia linei]
INTRADELMRILPKINEDINEEWISDKCRFSYDGLKRQRLLEPMIRSEDTKLLKKCHWKVALQHIAKNINVKDNIAAICGPFVDVETMVATKDLLNKFDSELICLDENFDTSAAGCDFRSSYLLGPKIKDIENSDLCFIIGTNPRYESPLLNARIRKGWLQKNNKIVYVGPKVDLNYDYEHAGESIDVLGEIMKGQHKLSKAIKKSSSPIVIVGENYFNYQTNGTAKYNNIVKFSNYLKINSTNLMMDSINFGVIHKSASTVGALEMNICPNISILKDTPIKVLLLIGCDKENVLNQVPIDSDAFIIYIGHHGDHGALISDVVLPSSAYTEKEATYLNNEGRSQKTNSAIFPSGASRDDWKIITAISHILEKPLKYESIAQLKERLNEISPNFQNYNGTCNMDLNSLILKLAQPKPNKVIKAIEVNQKQLSDYYLTDVISRSSLTMNKAYQATKQ